MLNKLTIAISSRALFDLRESHAVFEAEGVREYSHYQIMHENHILKPGSAFNLVKKFANIRHPETDEPLVNVVLVSRNSADTGLRIFNSIEHYGLIISRAAFTSGEPIYPYIEAFNADLLLSAEAMDVSRALNNGYAAATIFPSDTTESQDPELRIAFDGDAVIFSDEAEAIYQKAGLEAFSESEKNQANEPLPGGPFKGFLEALHTIQKLFPGEQCPIRTALVTARSAPAHERVIRTLRAWDIRIDEAIFLGGLTKAEFLKAFKADCFFDDQPGHCEKAAEHVTTGHVPYGVINEND